MYHLATLFPFLRQWRLPLSRDQFMLLMIAVNLAFLGIETYITHIADGIIKLNEWPPIVFGPIAALILLVAGLLAFRQPRLANILATLTLLASVVVGLLGAYFHGVRGFLPDAPTGEQLSISLMIWAPPILAPLMFCIVGIFGISAAWVEWPTDSGRLRLQPGYYLQLPYSKTQAYFYIVSMASLAALISSVLDHGRHNLENSWVWLPIVVGIFSTVVAAGLGFIDQPNRGDLITYVCAMLALIGLGLLGAWLHLQADLTARGGFVLERFLRGAPILGPMLFADVGTLGLLVLLDPTEER